MLNSSLLTTFAEQVCQLACSAHEPMFVCATATTTSAPHVMHSLASPSGGRPTPRSDPSTSPPSGSHLQSQNLARHPHAGPDRYNTSSTSDGVGQQTRLGRGRLSSWNMRAFKKVSSYSLPEHQEGAATSIALHPHGAWFAATVASPDGLHARPMLHMFDVAGRASLIRSIPLGSNSLSSPSSAYSSVGSESPGAGLASAPAVVLCELSGETCLATAVSSGAYTGGFGDGGDGNGASIGSGSSTLLQLWSLRKPTVPLSELLLPPLWEGLSPEPNTGASSGLTSSSGFAPAGHPSVYSDTTHRPHATGSRSHPSPVACSLASSPHGCSMAVLRCSSGGGSSAAWGDPNSRFSILTLVDWQAHLKGSMQSGVHDTDGGFSLRSMAAPEARNDVDGVALGHLEQERQSVLSASWPYPPRGVSNVHGGTAGHTPTAALTSLCFPAVHMQCISWHPTADMLMCGCSDGSVVSLQLGRRS